MRRRFAIVLLLAGAGPLFLMTAAGSAPVVGTVTLSATSGAPGSSLVVTGSVTCVASTQVIALVSGSTTLASQSTSDGSFTVSLIVPANAAAGVDQVTSTCDGSSATLGTFTVTPAAPSTTATPAPPTTATPTTPAPAPAPAPAAGAVTAQPRFTG